MFNRQEAVPFSDRTQAGRLLGEALLPYKERDDVVVLALPRGGVPVAFEVVKAINASLDLMLVRKLGTPGQEELAMGAIAWGGARVLNTDIIGSLGISAETIDAVASRESRELERRQRAYRGDRPPPQVKGRCVILVDDGLATGATMRSAIKALRQQHPARIVVAVPVAPPDTIETLRQEADEVVCLAAPEPFMAIGRWYHEFPQTSDDEVKDLLQRAWTTAGGAAPESAGT
ncbi:MAG: phosphoribosyltransferase [Burkholderiales bacterium]|nr:phosphoribosyltransferase [Burkholderiales bacterium]